MPKHYQGVEFTDSLRRVTPVRISKAEAELGVTFPEDYREFLLAVNGGVPNPGQFVMAKPSKPGEQICIDFFYGVTAKREPQDLLYEQQMILERTDSLPKGFITIGFDPGSAPYFISTSGKKTGGIYFFDPDGFLDPAGKPQLYLAAKNFTDLLVRLSVGITDKSEPDNESSTK